MTKLKDGRLSKEEWVEIIPEIGKSIKKMDVSPNGFLAIYQAFDIQLTQDGREFRCIGWAPPASEPYVDCVEVKETEAT